MTNNKLRIALAFHPELAPKISMQRIKVEQRWRYPWITEWDVWQALIKLGHEVLPFPVEKKSCIEEFFENNSVDIVFNLLEEFMGDSSLDYRAIDIFNKKKVPFTGEAVRGLRSGKDKKHSKAIAKKGGVLVPKTFGLNDAIFPSIVKFNNEDGSFAIFKKNIVKTKKELVDRYNYLNSKYEGELLIEEFIPGKEVYVSLMRDSRGVIKVFRPRELFFFKNRNSKNEIYSQRLKWSGDKKVVTKFLKDESLSVKIKDHAIRVYRAFKLQGAARIDFRVNQEKVYFLEINPNPNLAKDDDFCLSMMEHGYSYEECIQEILMLGYEKKVNLKAA